MYRIEEYEDGRQMIFKGNTGFLRDVYSGQYKHFMLTLLSDGDSIMDEGESVPSWVYEDIENYDVHDAEMYHRYTLAVERLARRRISIETPAVSEQRLVREYGEVDENDQAVVDSDGNPVMHQEYEDVVVSPAIPAEPATIGITYYDSDGTLTEGVINNPEIEKDEAERATAQSHIDATPQYLINRYNAENSE